ncbi:unnamed protein product [Durusdinium trenchii]|uniref:Uncharacterized protein n=1 Tax=Durusdinium trenchii TaxID=1381693 RepID=A0ABP0QUQ1_9DINO
MVSWCVSLVYGFPAFGFGAATVMISLFLPALYVDRLGVPLSHIGFVTTAVQLFDAVTDPLMGYLSDRAQFSSGRRRRICNPRRCLRVARALLRGVPLAGLTAVLAVKPKQRPFMLLGSWSLAASFVALFAPPKEGAGTALAWATTFALLTQLGLTCARVPWLAWGIELTNEYDKKTRLAPGAVSAMNSRRFARLPREREMAIEERNPSLRFDRRLIGLVMFGAYRSAWSARSVLSAEVCGSIILWFLIPIFWDWTFDSPSFLRRASTGATIFLMAAAFNFYFDGTRFTWKMWMDVVAVFVMMSVYATRAYYQPQKILLIGVLFISVTGFFALNGVQINWSKGMANVGLDWILSFMSYRWSGILACLTIASGDSSHPVTLTQVVVLTVIYYAHSLFMWHQASILNVERKQGGLTRAWPRKLYWTLETALMVILCCLWLGDVPVPKPPFDLFGSGKAVSDPGMKTPGDGGPKPTKHQECATPLPPQPDTSGGHAVHRPSTTASIFAKAPAEVRLRELGCRSASTGDLGEIVALESMEVFSRLTLMASVWAVAMAVHGTWCFCTVPDTAPTSVTSATTSATVARPTSKTWSFLRHVLEVRAAWSLWLATVLMSMAVVSNALLYPFFVKYVLREEGGLSTLLGLYILLGAVGVPLWAFASHRFDKRRTLAQATLLQGLALLVVFLFVEQGAVPIYSTCIVLAGLSFGGVPVLRFSMLADVADLAQLRSGGKRDEGKLVALFDISSKLAASALVALGFAVIDLSGYQAGQPDEEQGPASRLAIRIFYALVPALLAMLSALVVFCLYPLDRQQHTEILSELSRPTDADAAIVGKPMKAMNAGGAME